MFPVYCKGCGEQIATIGDKDKLEVVKDDLLCTKCDPDSIDVMDDDEDDEELETEDDEEEA
jgi:hypothetical protein